MLHICNIYPHGIKNIENRTIYKSHYKENYVALKEQRFNTMTSIIDSHSTQPIFTILPSSVTFGTPDSPPLGVFKVPKKKLTIVFHECRLCNGEDIIFTYVVKTTGDYNSNVNVTAKRTTKNGTPIIVKNEQDTKLYKIDFFIETIRQLIKSRDNFGFYYTDELFDHETLEKKKANEEVKDKSEKALKEVLRMNLCREVWW